MKRQINNNSHDDDFPQPKVRGYQTTDNNNQECIFRLSTGKPMLPRVMFQNGNEA